MIWFIIIVIIIIAVFSGKGQSEIGNLDNRIDDIESRIDDIEKRLGINQSSRVDNDPWTKNRS